LFLNALELTMTIETARKMSNPDVLKRLAKYRRFRVFINSGYAQTRTGSRCSVPAVPRELIPSSRRGFQSGPEMG
jgi:hypothetical protein